MSKRVREKKREAEREQKRERERERERESERERERERRNGGVLIRVKRRLCRALPPPHATSLPPLTMSFMFPPPYK